VAIGSIGQGVQIILRYFTAGFVLQHLTNVVTNVSSVCVVPPAKKNAYEGKPHTGKTVELPSHKLT
jgi:hypothetical protein